jgi:hypothetical protein
MLATLQSRTSFLLVCYLKTKIRIHKTIILPVDRYVCETWSLTLREEQRLSVLENKMLRRIFELKGVQVMGVWEKVHNE